MKLLFLRTPYPIVIDGEGMGTSSFQVGAGGVESIESTPMGFVIRRQNSLPDLLIGQGWGIVEKQENRMVPKKGQK